MTKKFTIITSVCIMTVITISTALHFNVLTLPIVKQIHVQSIADFSDDRVLMGASHNVFVGKVVKQVGSQDIGIGPETQFEVEVLQNIKGNLTGRVTVNQPGGYKDGILYTVESDVVLQNSNLKNYLLKPGSVYVFATRYNDAQNWFTVISNQVGKTMIDQGAKISEFSRIAQLQAAYKDEILLEADVKNNNTRNSYTSLPTSIK